MHIKFLLGSPRGGGGGLNPLNPPPPPVDPPLSFQLHSQYLDTTTAKKLVQAPVLCHLDYCNSLLYNRPDSQLGKLQIIQNSAARLITGILRNTHQLPRFDNSYIGYQLKLGSHLKFSYSLFHFSMSAQYGSIIYTNKNY